jgi:uncharacterized protein (DUF885 family)
VKVDAVKIEAMAGEKISRRGDHGLLATPLVGRAETPMPRFKQIYQQEWAWRTGQAGVSTSGESQPNNGRLDDVDAASQQQRLDYWQHVLKQLDGIDVAQLSPANRVNAAVYREQIGNFVADQHFMPTGRCRSTATRRSGRMWVTSWMAAGCVQSTTITSISIKLDQVPAYFDQQIANMRAGLQARFQRATRGAQRPRRVDRRRCRTQGPDPEQLLQTVQAAARIDQADEAQALQGEAVQRIRDDVIPAYAKLLTSFPQRIRAAGAHHAGRRGHAGRQGVLPPADPRIHHARPEPRCDPPDRPGPGGEDPCADARHDGADGLQGQLRRLPALPAH